MLQQKKASLVSEKRKELWPGRIEREKARGRPVLLSAAKRGDDVRNGKSGVEVLTGPP